MPLIEAFGAGAIIGLPIVLAIALSRKHRNPPGTFVDATLKTGQIIHGEVMRWRFTHVEVRCRDTKALYVVDMKQVRRAWRQVP